MATHARLALSKEDIDAVQRLRFEVYQEECGIAVHFDPRVRREIGSRDALASTHLILVEHQREPFGTARLALPNSEIARARGTRFGFEFEEEFDLSQFEIDGKVAEIARLCVPRRYQRTDAVLRLYEGLHVISVQIGVRYWLGAVDCQTAREDEARAMHSILVSEGHVSERFNLTVRPLACSDAHESHAPDVNAFYTARDWDLFRSGQRDAIRVATTLSTFTRRLGAKCVGLPARHPAFPRYVVPMLVDLESFPETTRVKFDLSLHAPPQRHVLSQHEEPRRNR